MWTGLEVYRLLLKWGEEVVGCQEVAEVRRENEEGSRVLSWEQQGSFSYCLHCRTVQKKQEKCQTNGSSDLHSHKGSAGFSVLVQIWQIKSSLSEFVSVC